MESDQYEELCRRFIAEQTGLREEDVKSISLPNAKRPGLPEYKHQVDLYWETGDAIALYLNIANAKWRTSASVDQGEVLLLQQVRQQVSAHKAFMITNVGFTAGAVAAAQDHGIALHVVAPTFDTSMLPRGDRVAILQAFRERASQVTGSLYSLEIVQRGLGWTARPTNTNPASTPLIAPSRSQHETRVVPPSASPNAGASANRAIGGGTTRTGFGSNLGSRGGGNFFKK